MKKKSILVVAISLFWVAYLAVNVGGYIYEMSVVTTEINQIRLRVADYQSYIAAPLLAEEQLDALSENLSQAKQSQLFDFFQLTQNGKVISSGGDLGVIHGGAREFKDGINVTSRGDAIYKTISIQIDDTEYRLTIGLFAKNADYIRETLNTRKWDLFFDTFLVSLILGGLLYLVLKDILDLTKILRKKDRSGSQLVKIRTREADLLLTVTNQYENMSKSLKLSNESLAESLSPAVRYELNEGTKAPHVFSAAVVRIDVNGYTQMFLEQKDEFVSSTLNKYFKQAAEIIQRYGGHIYQYVGDEIVFHFKQSDFTNVRAQALSCVRSLFEVAEDLDEDLRPQGIPFGVKASISLGKLRFIQLDTGFAFAGVPLIESVRMLGKIEERNANILAMYAEDFNGLEFLAKPFKRMQVEFKGFSKQAEIIEVKEFEGVNSCLEEKAWDQLKLFRSDRDLVKALQYLRAHMAKLSREEFSEFYNVLRTIPIQKVGGHVAEAFARVFVEITPLAQNSPEGDRVVASLTNLAARLLRSGAFDERVRELMEQNLKHKDQRVRANTVLALDELSPETYSFREMFSLPFNRAAADALMVEGKREYTQDIHRFLRNFLDSEDPFFMASGIYVLANLYDYHRQKDPIYFKANEWLGEIPQLLRRHLGSENAMVRKRAEMSLNLVEGLAAA